jgi:hypothetical protein
MSAFDRLAGLAVRIGGYRLEGRRRDDSGFERRTTIVHLHGAGEEGAGEDVVWDAESHRRWQEAEPALRLAGSWTLDSFSRHLERLDLFAGETLQFEVYRHYRRWALESAALDLALRQAGRSLAEVLEGTEGVASPPRPIRFVVSSGLGRPPTFEPCARRIAAYPGIRFKLDATPAWTDRLLEQLAASGTVDVIDFKGAYRGTVVDVDTDPALYRRVAEALPDAWLEDPDLSVPAADAALTPHRERISWDAPIHSVEDVRALPFAPRALNIKPSRFGSVRALLDAYEYCGREGIRMYGGGQAELGVGRGQIQYLAALFHPEAPNDVAPAGYDWSEFPTGLPPSPLAPDLDGVGFRRRRSQDCDRPGGVDAP